MKKTIKTNVQIEVIPDYNRWNTWEEIFAIAKEIEREINKHVDRVKMVQASYATEDVCSFCGSRWEVADEDWHNDDPNTPIGMPICCQKAQEEFENNLIEVNP